MALESFNTTQVPTEQTAKLNANFTEIEARLGGKLDKVTSTATNPRVYGVDSTGAQVTRELTTTATANAVAQRDANGRLQVGAPQADADAATKKYVDDEIASVPVFELPEGFRLVTSWEDLEAAVLESNIYIKLVGYIEAPWDAGSLDIYGSELTIDGAGATLCLEMIKLGGSTVRVPFAVYGSFVTLQHIITLTDVSFYGQLGKMIDCRVEDVYVDAGSSGNLISLCDIGCQVTVDGSDNRIVVNSQASYTDYGANNFFALNGY